MSSAPRNMRLHIGIFGRRNVGKSSLLNAVTRQEVAIVSPDAGTTTDPVEKAMELLPLGPVVFIDTAGIDDMGALGEQRVARTARALDRTDLGVVVSDGSWGEFERRLVQALRDRGAAVVAVLNKADLGPAGALAEGLRGEGLAVVETSVLTGAGLAELREALLAAVPADVPGARRIVADLVPPGELAVLVVPIDGEAPRGRLILPQVQTIRDLLDGDAGCVVVKEDGLRGALARLRTPPALVVTDSQAFARVAGDTPTEVPLTSFSILFARFQGDLPALAAGAAAMDGLRPGDRVLVAEGCTHHPTAEDIGRVKIPRWLERVAGGPLEITTVAGRDFPEDPAPFALVVHCGNCMGTRREMVSRILRCRRAGVPVTNYGVAIARCLGILERALAPFPEGLAAYGRAREAPRPATGPGGPPAGSAGSWLPGTAGGGPGGA